MGANASKPTPIPRFRPVSAGTVSEKQADELVQQLSEYLTLDSSVRVSGEPNPISTDSLEEWKESLFSEPKNRLAQAAISTGDISKLIRNRGVITEDSVHVFSDKVEFDGAPITNQHASGRCWIFASTNIFRVAVQKKYNIPEFQLSQAYLFFYDKLEKSNYFLQNVIETADLDLETSPLIKALFEDPVSDGGQWDMMVNLVEKYGLIPQTVFPDSFNAANSGRLDYIVVNKLREFALYLRKAKNTEGASIASLNTLKDRFVQQIYNILAISLGAPPKADEVFTWEYTDANDKAHTITSTPLDFYKSIVKFDAPGHFSLVHDPRNPYQQLYTVDRLNNMVGGKPIEYVNVPIDVLKQAAIAAIKNNEPVFFGSDVGKFSDTLTGIMDVKAWDYKLAFNTHLGMNKADRVRVGSSQMTHAMVLTAVNIVDGKPTKWKVMNSWGADVGDKGYMTMSDEWFDEYVYQVVTSSQYVEKAIADIWKGKDYSVLPRWDPFGSLA